LIPNKQIFDPMPSQIQARTGLNQEIIFSQREIFLRMKDPVRRNTLCISRNGSARLVSGRRLVPNKQIFDPADWVFGSWQVTKLQEYFVYFKILWRRHGAKDRLPDGKML